MLIPSALRAAHSGLVKAFGQGAAASRMMGERRELVGLRRNGQVFPLEAAITKVTLGGETTFTAHLRDVSARKAAQARLSESERRFRALFDHAASPMALLAPDGSVLEINRAAGGLTAGARAFTGRPLWTLPWLGSPEIDLDAIERMKRAVDAARRGLRGAETVVLCADGRERTITVWVSPVRDPDGRLIYVLAEGHEQRGPS